MLKKLRRSSKAKVQPEQPDPISIATVATQKQPTFFSLPAELRNDIYTLAAQDSTLHLFKPNNVKAKTKPIPALILASRQTRVEYLPILLSVSSIQATVTDFNFKDLQRVLSSLYSTELKALRSNNDLVVILKLKKCSDDVYPNLRRWCTARSTSLDKIAWRYELSKGIEPKVLRWFAERARVLYERVEEESIKWEVRRVSEALEADLKPFMRTVVVTGAQLLLEREQSGEGWVNGFGDDFVMMAATRRRRG